MEGEIISRAVQKAPSFYTHVNPAHAGSRLSDGPAEKEKGRNYSSLGGVGRERETPPAWSDFKKGIPRESQGETEECLRGKNAPQKATSRRKNYPSKAKLTQGEGEFLLVI